MFPNCLFWLEGVCPPQPVTPARGGAHPDPSVGVVVWTGSLGTLKHAVVVVRPVVCPALHIDTVHLVM